MRKHKSVVAILLAVMMIFTFMPTMAFADYSAKTVTWNGYDSVTVSGCTGDHAVYNGTYATEKVFQTEGENPGAVKVTAKVPADTAGIDQTILNDIVGAKFYYDLDNAVFAHGTSNGSPATEIVGTYVSYSVWNNNTPNGLLFKAPEGTYPSTATTVPSYFRAGTQRYDGSYRVSIDTWRGTIVADPTPSETKTDDQNITLSIDASWRTDTPTVDVNGAVKDKNVLIKGPAKGTIPTTLNRNLFVDNDDNVITNASNIERRYDGEEHTIYATAVKGYTVKYTVFDPKTGKWNAVDAVTYKDYAASTSVRVTYYDDSKASDSSYQGETPLTFSFRVREENSSDYALSFAYDENAFDTVGNVHYVAEGTEAKDTIKTNVYDADKETALKFFDEYFTLTTTVNKTNPARVTWSYKAITDKDALKALAEKYETLLRNYGRLNNNGQITGITAPAERTVEFVAKGNTEIDDITFSGVTTKTFKAKKKTKKLAKDKSFQVAATAASGNAVTFTATSSNGKVSIDATGKVTVKKGLKKGAKVKLVVKAHTAAGNGYKAASAEKTYTIKIK